VDATYPTLFRRPLPTLPDGLLLTALIVLGHEPRRAASGRTLGALSSPAMPCRRRRRALRDPAAG
jgi:hypothetical protein